MWNAIILYQGWTHIKILNLGNCKICDDSIDALLRVEWPNLTDLTMNQNDIGDTGVKKILQKYWKELTFLDLCTKDLVIVHNSIT